MSEARPKPWLPSPDDVQDEQGHVWFDYYGSVACKRCGYVKQRNGNRPCSGVLPRVALRNDISDIVPRQPHERRREG